MLKRYKTFDHTADLGIEVYGEDQNQLFSNAGFALFDLIAEADTIEVKTSLDLTVEEMNLEDLMVNWLRELLYLHQSERYLLLMISAAPASAARTQAADFRWPIMALMLTRLVHRIVPRMWQPVVGVVRLRS